VNFPVFGQSSRTSVRLATAQGYLDVVMFLYHIRVNLNLRDEIGQTALHIALFKDYSSIVKFLLRQGADKTAKDDDGKAPEAYATKSIVKWMLRHPHDFEFQNPKNGNTTFIEAAVKGGAMMV
jgi:ankyrin repeat protein